MAISVDKQGLKKFVEKWTGRGKEDEDDRSFWIDLLQDVFKLSRITDRLDFQKKVIGSDGNTKRIDVYIPETRVLIEQKSLNIPLDKPQTSHHGMTPYQQAKMYDNGLPSSEKANWIVTSNFSEIWIYDMDTRKPEENVVKLSLNNLEREYKNLSFLYDPQVEQITREFEISQEAGLQIGKIYDALLKQYPDNPSEDDLKNLNTFCVRLVFCYYAEDAGLFNSNLFSNYIASFNPQHLRNGLKELFRILNTKEEERDPFEEEVLLAFPYVNGGLFDGKNNIIPQMDDNIKSILVSAADFDWSDISPTIFGAIFESTLNQETRRSGGMHYTSIENIHKVIDPLFLNDLRNELEDIKASKQPNIRVNKLRAFQDKLASLNFLDPACGSGNFLTETYLSLRRLENDVIATINKDQIEIIAELSVNPIKVQLNQFYGIEINDFAVSVARTALWIAENQMMEKTKEIIVNADYLNFLPLKSFSDNIKEGNALQIDWNEVIDRHKCNYIMGNPPFIGGMMMKEEQKSDLEKVMTGFKSVGEMDYVTGWYQKAMEMMKDTQIRTAFVSTNSISQGQQATTFLAQMIINGMSIDFAYPTFIWDSEASLKAHVHCCIIGFSHCENTAVTSDKRIFNNNGEVKLVANINQYLSSGPFVLIESKSDPICNVPSIRFGSMPRDGGGFILSESEKDELIKNEPLSKNWIRMYLGAEEFLKGKKRYCLWLVDANPSELLKCPSVLKRIESVREFRLASKAAGTRKYAENPSLFCQIAQPVSGSYIAVPKTSSERRTYIPCGFLSCDVIASDLLFLIPDASIYHLGILESKVHMAWMRTVAGRLKSDYRYSKDIVYNNFPWPTPTDEQLSVIEKTATGILDARSKYPDCTLGELYSDKMYLFSDLVKAHEANDKAVMDAYGFSYNMTEPEIVAELMKIYQGLIENK